MMYYGPTLVLIIFITKNRNYQEIADEDKPILNIIQTNIAIVIGYTLSDILNIVLNFLTQPKYKSSGDIFTLIHHCFSLYGFSYALVSSILFTLKKIIR